MIASAESLWRLNQEYGHRLAKARTYLDLLEELMTDRSGSADEIIVSALQFTRAHLNGLKEEYRAWRYTYFYEAADTKRMVQTTGAIRRAVASFARMRTRHETYLNSLFDTLDQIPRPSPDVTTVPNGDLWEMMRFALYDLLDFSSYLKTLDTA